jgi:hypothetical protein
MSMLCLLRECQRVSQKTGKTLVKLILTEAELIEALIIWGVEKGVRLPDDIKVKVRRKSRTDETAGTIVIDVPEPEAGAWSKNPVEDQS